MSDTPRSTIARGTRVSNARGDWQGTVRLVRSDGTAWVEWDAPMPAKSIDHPVSDLRPYVHAIDRRPQRPRTDRP